MATEKGIFEEGTIELYDELFAETAKELGFSIPKVARVVNFTLEETSRLIQSNELVEIKYDYLGKIRHKGYNGNKSHKYYQKNGEHR